MTQSKREQAIEKIAETEFERGIGTLVDFYKGIENIPAELLDKTWETEISHAQYVFEQLESLGMCFRAQDQSLPGGISNLEDWTPEDVESETWKRMLTPKDGTVWVKIETEE